MEDSVHKELQLLPSSLVPMSDSPFLHFRSAASTSSSSSSSTEGTPPMPSLDLQLSISLRQPDFEYKGGSGGLSVEALKWKSAEEIRLAAMEKAYAERVRELTRREMEMAQSEFARARHVRERAWAEVERAERMKERATVRHIGSACMEITCQSCRQRFFGH